MKRCPLCGGAVVARRSERDWRGEGPHDKCGSVVVLSIALELRNGRPAERYVANVLLRMLPTKLTEFDGSAPGLAYMDAPGASAGGVAGDG